MTLTPGQWAAIDAIIATHCPNTALITAVENELRKAHEMHIPESENDTETGRLADVKTARRMLETSDRPGHNQPTRS